MYGTSDAALLNKYQNDSVMTASPMDLVVMLYDALIKQIKLSDIFLENREYEKVNQHLSRAEDIVSELLCSLDLSYPISEELMKLYDFMLQELIQINLQKDRSRIPPLLEIVESLREAWVSVRNGSARAFAVEE